MLSVKDEISLCITFIIVMIMGSCANPISPTGGEKDISPPILNIENSTQNLQTKAQIRKIDLKFDEWVVISNFLQEVIVSPPLQYTPSMNTKGKGIRFELDEREELKENTTYVINFGQSIKDLTEGNAFENYSFVFSTGDQLDKQKISGRVYDAFSNKIPEGAIVVLYDEIQDSIIYQERPTYFSKVDKQGRFQFDYIREDTFLIFTLIDLNRNYLFDGQGESLGFLDSTIYTFDTSLQNIQLSLSKPIPPFQVLDFNQKSNGKVTLSTEGQDSSFELSFHPRPTITIQKSYDDSLVAFFYPIDTAYTIISKTAAGMDTFYYKQKTGGLSALKFIEPRLSQIYQVKSDGKIDCAFNHPISEFDLNNWIIESDSGKVDVPLDIIKTDSSANQWTLRIIESRSGVHMLEVLPHGLTDMYGQNLLDTITIKYRSIKDEELGQITVLVKGLDSMEAYLCELIFDESPIESFYISNASSGEEIFKLLTPGQYEIRIIEDRNRNKKWDPGNYFFKSQPEPLINRTLETLRPNWEVQAEITWK